MGISSERTGPTGPASTPPTACETPPRRLEADPDVLPSRAQAVEETNPEGLEPKAGYPSKDPRSD